MSQSQVLGKPAPPAEPVDGTLAGLLFYVLLIVAPIGLKLAGYTRVATWSWWKVTAVLWLPWGLLGVVSAVGFLWYLVSRPRRG